MFTGIIEEVGVVTDITRTHSGVSIKVKADIIISGLKSGDSVAINGVCLSVTRIDNKVISFDAMPETLKRTNIGELKISRTVNLERSLRSDARIGGHFVLGHVDYKGKVIEILKGPEGTGFKVSLPDEFSGFVVKKGSVAVDGVSLTVAEVQRGYFAIYLIPHTFKTTTFADKKKGDWVNIETDLIGKYIVKGIRQEDITTLLKKYEYI